MSANLAHCPVTADLNRYSAQQDRDDARAEAIDDVADKILAGGCKRVPLHTLVDDWIANDEGAARTIAAALASDSFDGLRTDPVFRAALMAEAEAEYERQQRASEDDAGEARYEAMQDARGGW